MAIQCLVWLLRMGMELGSLEMWPWMEWKNMSFQGAIGPVLMPAYLSPHSEACVGYLLLPVF